MEVLLKLFTKFLPMKLILPTFGLSWKAKMTFEEMFKLVSERKRTMPEGSGTTQLFKKGAHGIGKKLAEEASESWMAARFESKEECAEELSQVLYYVACMMAEKNITLEEVYKTLWLRWPFPTKAVFLTPRLNY